MKQWTAEEIKAFRQRLNLYQRDFARMLRVSREYVGFLERGSRSPGGSMKALLDCLEEKENEKGKESKHGKKGAV